MAIAALVMHGTRLVCATTLAIAAFVVGDRLGGIVGDGILRRYT